MRTENKTQGQSVPVNAYREIVESDVGQPFIEAFGETWSVADFIGRIMQRDVGKRIYKRGDILQVENDEQRNARTSILFSFHNRVSVFQSESHEEIGDAKRNAYLDAQAEHEDR